MKIKGEVKYKVIEHGNVIAEHVVENLVVNIGKETLAKLMVGDAPTRLVDSVGFGEGATAPSSLDSSLTNQFIKAIDGYTYPAINKVAIDWSCTLTECNGMTITEFGLFSQSAQLFARRLALSPIVKTGSISISGTWTITF